MVSGRTSTWLGVLVIALATSPVYALVEGPDPLYALETSTPGTGAVILSHTPADYDWWNGCSPTAAGMLFGWWEEETSGDYDAFPGDHRNLPDTYANTSLDPGKYRDARGVIASWAHKSSGVDLDLTYGSYRNHAPDCLADFILTENGNTNRSKIGHGLEMFAAWDDPQTTEIESRNFTTQTHYVDSGWSFSDYCAEIDAGRPVHLGLTRQSGGHSVLGVGYNNTGGLENIVVLTTWHQDLQEWEWDNEDESEYSAYAATTMEPLSDPTPELSAYLFLAHDDAREYTVTIGVGDPNNPDWSTTVWDVAVGLNYNIVLTDIDCTAVLDDFMAGELDWFIEVENSAYDYRGTIQDFQIRLNFEETVFHWDSDPVGIIAKGETYAYLTTELIPGDATGDGVVDELDSARLDTYWGLGDATWGMGDFDHDGTVGPGDAAILAANWGHDSSEQGDFDMTAVPEPSMFFLLLGILPWSLARKKRP